MVKPQPQSEHTLPNLERDSTTVLFEREREGTLVPKHVHRAHTLRSEARLAESEWEVQCPLQLRLRGVKGGKVDLQLQIVSVSYGLLNETQSTAQLKLPEGLQDAGKLVGTAASLGFLRIAFPERAPGVQRWLARLGTTQAMGVAAGAAAEKLGWKSPDISTLRSAAGRRLPFLSGPHKTRRSVSGLQTAGMACGRKCNELACPAALMAAAAFLWRQVHPNSHQLLQAIVVAIELSTGYAETKRKAATGAIRSGPQLEAAWRARHKWAARRASKVLTDSYSDPPLKPFLSAAQKLSIGLLLLVDSPTGVQHTLNAAHQTAGVAAGWSAPGHDSNWILSLSYPIRQGKHFKEGDKRTAGEVAAEAPINTGTAGQDTPAHQGQQNNPSPVKLRIPTTDIKAVSGAAADTEKPAYFQPLPAEDLRTGGLPTICCMEDIKRYKEKAAAAEMQAAASPFATQGGSESDEIKEFSTEELVRMDPGINQPGGHNQRDELMEGSNLALYGRGDHLTEEVLTFGDKQSMTLRAFYLLAVFLPFLLLGPIFMLLSNKKAAAKTPAVVSAPPTQADNQIGESLTAQSSQEVAIEQPSSRLRLKAYHLLLWGIRQGGAAFIKWGQWSATREDMFPPELCRVLAELHDHAPVHSWRESKREIEASFKRPVEELFESIDHEPLASGSIAQVHRAIMVVDSHRRSVVVKVRHPGVEVRIRQDFQILKPLAAAAAKFQALKGLSLKESLAQFSSTMTAQTDLRVEAAHLRRFFRNFAAVRGSVTPPFPLPDYITEAVLIETFEPGQSVAKYIRNPAPFNTQVVALGVDTYLKMLLTDNFVHTDLHPGNILVRRRDGGELSTKVAAEDVRGQLQLILLDFGLAEELTPSVRHHFISFLHMIARGDGVKAAGHILKWSTNQTCPDPAGFTAAMVEMFKSEAQIDTPEGIELDKVMKAVLGIARRFEVTIDSSYAALVIGVVVLVGFATSMDPAVNLMDAAAPAFLQTNLLGKVTGRLYT